MSGPMVYLSKHIIFTKHARDQIKRRGLTEAWVVDIIKHHDISYPIKPDKTQEFRKEKSKTYYFAVVEHKKSVLIVITAGETRKP